MDNDTKTIALGSFGCLGLMALLGFAIAIPIGIVVAVVKWIVS